MNNKHDVTDILDKLYKQRYNYVKEEDYYFISDDRYLESGIDDIVNGDNFADYCEYIFDYLEEEGYYD